MIYVHYTNTNGEKRTLLYNYSNIDQMGYEINSLLIIGISKFIITDQDETETIV